MFANFIYLIIAILIYAVYQPSQSPGLSAGEAWSLAAAFVIGFNLLSRWLFRRLSALVDHLDAYSADHRHSGLVTRQCMLAVVLFAVLVHALGLPAYLDESPVFRTLPTLLALVFLLLFLLLLSIVWYQAYPSYRRLYGSDISRRGYLLSNWRMSVPILIPWIMISLIADVIFALPFEGPKAFLATTGGEAAYFLVFLLFVGVFAPVVIQRLWGCYPLEAGFHRERIEALCARAGIGYRNIVYWPIFGGRMLTAGVMGIARRFRYILVTKTLLRTLTPEEVDAVIAHEIGHVKKHHLVYYIAFIVGFMLIAFAMNNLTVYLILFARPLYQAVLHLGMDQGTLVSTLFSGIFLVVFLVYFRFIFGYFMRTFERQADVFVYSLFDSARPMIATFQKIVLTSGQSPDKPNWHHYSIRERITYLMKCEQDRRWVERHHRKVRLSLLAFALTMVLVGVLGYQINYGSAGRQIDNHFFEKILEREIARTPLDPLLYNRLGNLRYSQNDLAAAARAYERSLELDPDNPEALNNLAWLYATSEEDALRQPARALALARRAADLDPSSHVLDTLAESYFVNGDTAAAVDFARQALEKAHEKRDYYRSQLEKFKEAGASSEH